MCWLSLQLLFVLLLTNGRCEVLIVQLCQRSRHIFLLFYIHIYIHPFFCARVIQALLCTSLASPSVFKRLLRWENEIGTCFVSVKLRPCIEKTSRSAVNCLARTCMLFVPPFISCVCCCLARHTSSHNMNLYVY